MYLNSLFYRIKGIINLIKLEEIQMKKNIFLLIITSLTLMSSEVRLIKDSKYKLIWEDNKHVEKERINHIEAIKYCNNLKFGTFKWRMPTLNELLTIVDYKRYKPATLKEFEHVNRDRLYWSTTPYARSSNEYWGVNFKDGSTSNASQRYNRYVRCVADLK